MVEYNSEMPIIPNLEALKFLINGNTKREWIISRQIIKSRFWFYALWSVPDGNGDRGNSILNSVCNSNVFEEMDNDLTIQMPLSMTFVSNSGFDLL